MNIGYVSNIITAYQKFIDRHVDGNHQKNELEFEDFLSLHE